MAKMRTAGRWRELSQEYHPRPLPDKEFARRGTVVDLAVGIVIGGAYRFSICRIACLRQAQRGRQAELHSADRENSRGPSGGAARPAGCKPAIQQIENLRYELRQSELDAALCGAAAAEKLLVQFFPNSIVTPFVALGWFGRA